MGVLTRPAASTYFSPPWLSLNLGFLSPSRLMSAKRDGEEEGAGIFDDVRAARLTGTPDEAANRILADLKAAAREREVRAADAGLRRSVDAVKAYQQRRFEDSYADLLADPRYAKAVRFFIDELNSPQDFAEREAQIAGILPTLVRAFPREVVDTVAALVALHALSESLDTDMGRHLRCDNVTRQRYVAAWRATGRAADRQRQVELTLAIGRRLDGHTCDPLLGSSLRMMRGPALLTGLGALQHFLETGFDAFASMRGATRFLAAIDQRENALRAALFGEGMDDDALAALLQAA